MYMKGFPPFLVQNKKDPTMLKVIVVAVPKNGHLSLVSSPVFTMGGPPVYFTAIMPVPNQIAHRILCKTLNGNMYDWLPIYGPTLEYNHFFDNKKNDVTYELYTEIAYTLIEDVVLPQVSRKGTCRISPLCDMNCIYVQTQPVYVDTISYIIHFSVDYKKTRKLIKPAEEVEEGGGYIFWNGKESYRVELLERVIVEKSEPYLDHTTMMREPVNGTDDVSENENGIEPLPNGTEQENKATSKDAEKEEQSSVQNGGTKLGFRDHYDPFGGERAIVSPIDFGGPPMEVSRSNLYDVDSVCPALIDIPPLAFRVNFGFINESTENRGVLFEELKKSQKLITIKTVFGGYLCTPPIVDVFDYITPPKTY